MDKLGCPNTTSCFSAVRSAADLASGWEWERIPVIYPFYMDEDDCVASSSTLSGSKLDNDGDNDEGNHMLVGEAYIHEFTAGGALGLLRRNAVKKQYIITLV